LEIHFKAVSEQEEFLDIIAIVAAKAAPVLL
jgi:hypothetical protein